MELLKRIEPEVAQLKKQFPKLFIAEKEKYYCKIKGEIEIIDPNDGQIWDAYSVEIVIKNAYPSEIPVIYEKGDKIKLHKSFDGSCCLAPRVEEYLVLGRDYNLCDYLNKLVVPYLAAQKLVELGEDWPNGEYSHHGKGIIEYYQEKLNTKDIEIILNCLNILSGQKKISRNTHCFCGSGKKYKNCHNLILGNFRLVNRTIFQRDLMDIKYDVNK